MNISENGKHRTNHPWRHEINPNRRWIYVFAVCFVLITCLPYWIGYASQGESYFSGFVFGVEDGSTYIAKMLRGAQGDWLFRSPFTAYAQNGAFIFLPYLLLGKLSAPPNQHDQLVVLFHLFRVLGGVLSVVATYDFMALFLREERVRRLGVVWVSLGGGLGWVLILLGKQQWLGSLPIDFYSPETFGFLAVYGIAHLTWARAFLLWGLRGYLVRGDRSINQEAPLCRLANLHPGILWLITGIMQPITGMLIGAIAAAHFAGLAAWQGVRWMQKSRVEWDRLKGFLVSGLQAGLVALPLVVYYVIIFSTDPYLTVWREQNRLPPPHWLHYLAAYGLVLPFVLVGILIVLKNRLKYGSFLVIWLSCIPVLISINLYIRRRLIEGAWVVLVTLALVAFENYPRKWFRRSYLLGIFSLPTTLVLLSGGIGTAQTIDSPVFYQADEIAAYQFIAETAEMDSVVLSGYDVGNALPAWAPVFVLIGHRPESAGIKEIEPRVKAFFQEGTTDINREALLKEFGVDYVFWGPEEREYGQWNPRSAGYLQEVFEEGTYTVFTVTWSGN